MAFLIRRVLGGPVDAGASGLSGTAQMSQVAGDVLLVGRGGAANLRFEETSVGLEHARVARTEDGGLEVVDLGSVTGTYVNGKRVERALVGRGDWVEIGRHRMSFAVSGANTPVIVEVQELAAERAPAITPSKPPPPRAAAVDYLRAYALERRWLGRGLFSALFVAATAAGLWAVVRGGIREPFRPGPVSSAHAPIGANCAACHSPWRGAPASRCETCHAGPEHQPTQVAAPACTTCHVEHRLQPVLQRVRNEDCLSCHRDLKVKGGQTPRFARSITDFGTDHPAFALSFDHRGGDIRRVPLKTAIAEKLDPTILKKFGHALHLRPDLKGPAGPVQLDCFSCHTPAQRSGELEPVRFARHCASCHYPFDSRRPPVPHASPDVVDAFVLRSFVQARPSTRSLAEQRRVLLGSPSALPQLRLDERVRQQVIDAENDLYRSSCIKCHAVDDSRFPPVVTPPVMVAASTRARGTRWLEYADFTHQPHRKVACTTCHERAAASTDTAEILLPDIETCRQCHARRGEGPTPATAGATTQCISCHLYHDKSRTGEWGKATPRGLWETASGHRTVAAGGVVR